MVKFQCRIGRAFLDYRWHPITIPKTHCSRLEQEGLAQDSVSIESPFGSMPGSLVYSRAGYGPYYQIRMDGRSTRAPMSELQRGQYITVELDGVGKIVCVTRRTA
jgi:hypothetical protein